MIYLIGKSDFTAQLSFLVKQQFGDNLLSYFSLLLAYVCQTMLGLLNKCIPIEGASFYDPQIQSLEH